MSRFLGGLAIMAVACGGVATAGKTPTAVEQAVTRVFGAKLAVEHEREGGVDVYEVEKKTELSVGFDDKGAVHYVEVEIPLGVVPANVMTAVKTSAPAGAKAKEASLIVRGTTVLYEVEVADASGKETDLVFTATGTLSSKAAGDDKDGDDKDGDDKDD